jgi:hypothetical protein
MSLNTAVDFGVEEIKNTVEGPDGLVYTPACRCQALP